VSPGRTLPLRVPIVPGEALDSWLEALARRHQVRVGTLTAALGWPVPATPGGLVAGIPAQVLRRLEHLAGLPARRLDVAVLDRHLPPGPVRRRGSRYCPSCLAERDGRWLLAWRLGWTFACTTHRVLLCDTCPGCGQAPRGRSGRAGLNPPGTCPQHHQADQLLRCGPAPGDR
jgi:TniQ